MSTEKEMVRFGVSMEAGLLERFDRLCETKGYATRSEAIRDLARNALIEHEARQTEGGAETESAGTLTVVYDHHQRELESKMTEYQHRYLDQIVSSLHVHLDAHLCLEVLVLRGKGQTIQAIADGLIATKGVRHGKLVLTTAHSLR